jgi:steroid delta-isomerase-like uncharacterized protein
MTRAEIENLVLGIYRATETGDVSILDDVVHDDVVEHPLNPGQLRGREPLKQLFGGLSRVIPDLTLTVEDVVSKQEMVAVRSVVRGTPAVAFLGVPPKGQVITFGALDMWRVADGRVAEGWHVEDFARVLIDLGVVRLPLRRLSGAPTGMERVITDETASAEAMESVIRRWYTALHRGDLTAASELLAEGFVNHDSVAPGLSPAEGRDGTLQAIGMAQSAFPDLDITVADLFGGSGKVAARVIVRGTHLGVLPGIPPTGKRFAVMGQEIWRVTRGRIVEHWGRFEELDLLQQLGVLPLM